jgi:serine/threonine-protein kinase
MDDPSGWADIEAALDELLELPQDQRAAALNRIAATHPAMRSTLEALLSHADGADALLDHPAIDRIAGATPIAGSLPAGTRIGAYGIVRLLGHGGMGEVYYARRADGQFEQEVALKLVRLEPGASLRRFHSERRILAELAHPNIARLLDGGLTDDGRPYMVMEYVEGLDLVAWCGANRVPLRPRLQLFLQVCDAVAYAHAHSVVHRDIKPANIIVAAGGRIKLLDFGIAKLLESGKLGDTTITTHVSPAYAAPEQLTGGIITTATDVYGLGVTLYQLLCGRLPWEVSSLPLASAVQRLLVERPAPPSAAVHAGALVTARELRGDLDAIVAKALRKEPQARYPTADSLAAEITRHLNHEPVRARDGARAYVMQSFVRRNWVPLAVIGLVFLLLVAGIAGTSWQATIARRQAERAEAEAEKATAVKDFLLDIFKQSGLRNPGGVGSRQVTAEKLLDIGAERIQRQLYGQPEVRGELLDTLASLYDDLGLTDRAVTLATTRLADLSRRDGAAAPWESAQAEVRLARALIDDGRTNEANGRLDAAMKALDAIGDRDSMVRADADLQLARAADGGSAADRSAGRAHLHEALRIVQRRDPKNPLQGEILRFYGEFAQLDEDYTGAEVWLKQSLAFEQTQGTERNGFAIGNAFLELGDVQATAGEYGASEANLRNAIALLGQAAGPEHPRTAMAESRLGEMYSRMGRLSDARVFLSEALLAQRKTAEGADDATETRKALGAVEYLRGSLSQAETVLRENLAQLGSLPDKELRYGVSASALVSVLAAEGRFDEAERLSSRSSDILRRLIGEKSNAYAGALLRGAFLKISEGQLVQAAEIYRQVLQDWPFSADFPFIYTRAVLGLARTELRQGRIDAARSRCEDLLRRIADSPDARYMPDQQAHALRLLGEARTRSGRAAEAEIPLRRALELREGLDDADSFWLAEARVSLAEALIAQRQLRDARRLLEQAAAAQARQPSLSDLYRAPLRAAQRALGVTE